MSEKNSSELAKSYDPSDIEARWYPIWEERGYFNAGLDPDKPSFAIQLPPPNITGILHMGHAFNQTVMDTLTRYHRMAGYNVDSWYGPRRYRHADRGGTPFGKGRR